MAEQRSKRRIDAVRNRARLIDAAGFLFRDHENATMPEIAKRAELSVATAYRFFPSLDDLRTEYLRLVIVELAEYSQSCSSVGKDLFADVLGEWLRMQSTYGDAIIHLRSREGYLSRLHAGDPVITTVRSAWERPISHLLDALKLNSIDLEDALYLHNIMFDPRELRDLRMQRKWSNQEIATRLSHSYCALLRSWTTND
ncbi:TetR/AcrR family transcriptional regulator [uncultured Brevibacterium sp.]|uniref:TetR/AcrR family transcriptional regulator n=1 Tax=uncultured Brevibacterium sp. TaxID=189678 RepID=UPI0025D1658B|nr:TetR/AcrR family transcriptional regulator [uncultured Brevibacterium sp.]